MADDLTNLWVNFSLMEEEDEEVEIQMEDLSGTVKRGHSCLMGKLIVDRLVSKETIKSTLIKGWKPSGLIGFKVLGANLFLVEFEHFWDKSRVLEGRPWIF